MTSPFPLSRRRIDTWIDPVRLFHALSTEATLFWLDAGSDAVDGWSVLGVGDVEADHGAPGRIDLTAAPQHGGEEPPFPGGWVGWLDYESGALAAGAPAADSVDQPRWMRITRAVAFDHQRARLWALAPADLLDAWTVEVRSLLTRATRARAEPIPAALVAEARHEPDAYAALIERCREAIRAGDAYQLCLTTRFTVPGDHSAVNTYLRLREATPAHHGGFVRIGDRALLSASPELFLHADRRRVRTRPIKGTRPRGRTTEEDRRLATELVESEKERAENVMIVDLMRNDLSQVCTPGSIRVEGLWQVESYPAVHQLVSTVSGELVSGATFGDLTAAAFPAGSMTGAPKLAAMRLLHDLERSPRGIYSGAFGHVGLDGTIDLAMVIRSIVVTADEAVVGAGGGITWRSEALAEVDEVATKASAGLRALGAALPEAWRSA